MTNMWPLTEATLLNDKTIGPLYAGAKATAITDAISGLYTSIDSSVTVPDLTDIDESVSILQEHIAELAMIRMIPMGKDFYMQLLTSLAESYNPGGSSYATYLNRVNALEELEDTLKQNVKARLQTVITIIVGESPALTPTFTFFGLAKKRCF